MVGSEIPRCHPGHDRGPVLYEKNNLEFAALLALKAESDWRVVCLALHEAR